MASKRAPIILAAIELAAVLLIGVGVGLHCHSIGIGLATTGLAAWINITIGGLRHK